jgi:hypothetical protein
MQVSTMTSSLTRHLYTLDEVVSALQLCLRFRRSDETPFWLWELVRSNEAELAHQTLRQAWLDFGGGWFAPAMLTAPPKTDTAWLQRLDTVVQAIELAGTASSIPLMTRTANTPRPGTTSTKGLRAAAARAWVATLAPAEGMPRDQAALWYLALHGAIRAKNAVDVAWLLQAAAPVLSVEAIWAALQGDEAVRNAATLHPVSQIQHQITAALLMMGPTDMQEPTKRRAIPADAWVAYDATLGRRTARRFPIPTMALHSETTRGRLADTETNIDDLHNPIPHLAKGCAFWRTELRKFPDTTTEEFHAAYFPDDIPDEWSAADQQKSHGSGVASTAPPIPALREEPVADLDAALEITVYRA